MSSNTFDIENDDLSGFSKQARRFIDAAHALGWTLRWVGRNNQTVQVISPNGEKSINVPKTSINANRVKSWVNALSHHSEPDAFHDYVEAQWPEAARQKPRAPRPELRARETAFGVGVVEYSDGDIPPMTMRTFAPDEAQVAAEVAAEVTAEAQRMEDHMREEKRKARRQAEREASRLRDRISAEERARLEEAAAGAPEVTVVSEGPWMVRQAPHGDGTGMGYESHSVIQKVMSDGSVVYRCRFCHWPSNENPRSVSTHASKAHPEHPAPKNPTLLRIQKYEDSGITHDTSPRRRLRSDLLWALDTIDGWEGMGREELAAALAEAVYDHRPDRQPSEPLTPEQVIRRIEMLVDGGRAAALHQQVEATAARLREAEESLSEQRERADRLAEERRALRELLSEGGES